MKSLAISLGVLLFSSVTLAQTPVLANMDSLVKVRFDELQILVKQAENHSPLKRHLVFSFSEESLSFDSASNCEDPAFEEFKSYLFAKEESHFELILSKGEKEDDFLGAEIRSPFRVKGVLEKGLVKETMHLSCITPFRPRSGRLKEPYFIEVNGWLDDLVLDGKEAPEFEGSFTLWIPSKNPDLEEYCDLSFFTRGTKMKWAKARKPRSNERETPQEPEEERDKDPVETEEPPLQTDSETSDLPEIFEPSGPASQPSGPFQEKEKLRPFSRSLKEEPLPKIKLGGGGCASNSQGWIFLSLIFGLLWFLRKEENPV